MDRSTLLITGVTGLLGSRSLAQLLRQHPHLQVLALIRDPSSWGPIACRLGDSARRVRPLVGDIRAAGLGLDRATRHEMRARVETVVHLAADTVFSRSLEEARSTNTEGTRHVLELVAPKARFCYVSTAFVAGRRTGRILESDPGGQLGWVNSYEQSKWEAEQLVRRSGRDFVVLRSSTVVCDSDAGEITQYNAVHRALRLFHAGLAPMIPGRQSAPIDLVTTEYVSDAIASLCLRRDLDGETVHLCAGDGAATLGDLLDLAYGVWAQDPAWKRRSIARPALTDLDIYRRFEEAVDETADARLRQAARALSFFVPQLSFEKRFDTTRADAALGRAATPVRDYWARVVANLTNHPWFRSGMAA